MNELKKTLFLIEEKKDEKIIAIVRRAKTKPTAEFTTKIITVMITF